MDNTKFEKSEFKGKIKEMVFQAESLRRDKDNPVDITFAEIVKSRFNIGLDGLYQSLGINPSVDTVNNLVTMPDMDVRWIIPEIFRDALRLGYRRAPIWPNITAIEEQMKGLTAVMPHINMSDASPKRVNEGETIPLGAVSYGSKSFQLFKVGRGISLSYEVLNFVSLNLVSIFLQDFGVKMGHAADVLAIDCLINGDSTDGSESAPVIGVTTPGTLAYSDLLRIFIRMARIGRTPTTIVSGEAMGLKTLNLTEFKTPVVGDPLKKLNLRTPVPSAVDYFIHGVVGTQKQIMVDPKSALAKFTAVPLLVEGEKIVSNQTQAFYASTTTGFAKLFRDASVILNEAAQYPATSTNQYGLDYYDFLNIDPLDNVTVGQ